MIEPRQRDQTERTAAEHAVERPARRTARHERVGRESEAQEQHAALHSVDERVQRTEQRGRSLTALDETQT